MATARLQWTKSSDDGAGDNDVNGYEIARATSPNATTIVHTAAAGVVQHDDTVSTGTYYWRIRAKDTAGNRSAWTSEVSQTIDEDPPAAPTGLTVTII